MRELNKMFNSEENANVSGLKEIVLKKPLP